MPISIEPGDVVFIRANVKAVIHDINKGTLYLIVPATSQFNVSWEVPKECILKPEEVTQ